MKGLCDVCLILDKDYEVKYVNYCKTCDAFMCVKCESNWLRRGLAAIKKAIK